MYLLQLWVGGCQSLLELSDLDRLRSRGESLLVAELCLYRHLASLLTVV